VNLCSFSISLKQQRRRLRRLALWELYEKRHQKQVMKVRNFQPFTLSQEVFNQGLLDLANKIDCQVDSPLLEWYIQARFKEFSCDVTKILFDNLQPGRMKYGNRLILHSLPYFILDRYLCQFKCYKKVTETSVTLNDVVVPVKIFKYKFMMETGFPTFSDFEWWYNFHLPTNDKPLRICKYTDVTFITNTWNSTLHCSWQMESLYMESYINSDGDEEGGWYLTT